MSNNIELRSKEIQEIVGKVPPIIIRIGISSIFIVLIIIVTCLYFIPYNKFLSVDVEIYKTNNEYLCKAYIPINKINDIQIGKIVFLNIKQLDNQDFIPIKSKIDSICYNTEIINNERFQTSHGQLFYIAYFSINNENIIYNNIKFLNELSGTANIEINKKNMLKKFLGK
ncbi:MAG: hypothetical protein LBV69_10920 [Bacteroidales bacterium]|jgi:hypothetical protein|nr:hypothetical protein [Bacteroidales bacterium]